MAVDARKHVAPAAAETPRRQAINDLSLSIRDVIPVANVTERAQLVSDLDAAGQAPSASNPLYVHRSDAGGGRELEYTSDGTAWRSVATTALSAPHAVAAGSVSITTTAAIVVSAEITLPAGRFTQTPIMPAPNVRSVAGGLTAATARAVPTSPTAATIYLYSATGANFTAGLVVPVDWVAYQMRSDAAAG